MLIVGAGGLAIQNIDLLAENGLLEEAVFFTNILVKGQSLFMNRFPVIQHMDQVQDYFAKKDNRFVVLVGGPDHRERLFEEFTRKGGVATSLISSKASLGGFDTSIGAGAVVMNQAVIESTVEVGKGALINIAALITHESVIGDFSEVGPGAKLCGKVKLGKKAFIGAGAILLPGIEIGEGSIVGAGAVVTRNVAPGTKVAGSPAKPL